MNDSRRLAPGPTGWPFIGNLPELRNDVLQLMMDNFHQFGDLVRFKLGPLTVHLLSAPDQIERVLKDNANFDKQTRSSSMIRRLTGESLLVSDGELWKRQRRAIQPAFAPDELRRFIPLIVEETDRLIQILDSFAESGQSFDIASQMMQVTYRIIERALFSTEPANDSGALGELESAIAIVLEDIYRRIETPFSLPSFVPTRQNRRYQEAMNQLNSRVESIIQQHLVENGDANSMGCPALPETKLEPTTDSKNDLLQRLILGGQQMGGIDTTELRNEAITLLIAGHETTANGLAWLFYLVSQHADVEEKLVNEVDDLEISSSGRGSQLAGLEYTSATIRESFRLYPPIWAIVRRVVTDQEIDGCFLPAGSRLVISPYVVHRHPKFWERAAVFDPDRSDPEHQLARIEFGGGSRICVGQNLARLESQIIVAKLLQRFRFVLTDPQNVRPHAGITLKPQHGIQMRVERR